MTTQQNNPTAPTIALVDDDTTLLDLMHDLLTDEGYQTTIHPSRAVTYQQLRDQQPNLIIQDMHIGDERDGWAVLDLLALDPTTTHLPIIVCSTDRRFLDAKADYLHKHGIHA